MTNDHARTLSTELGDRVGEVTVVFGNGVPALRGRVVGRRTDYFVLQQAGEEDGGQLHLIRWNAVAYVRTEASDGS